MSKKVIRTRQPTPASRSRWIWGVAAVLLLGVGALLLWNGWRGQVNAPPQVTGSPRLAVDQTTIDEGDVKLGKTIRTAFRLQNVGDQPLQILDRPQVEVVEGC